MQPKKSLTVDLILTKSTQPLFSANCVPFSQLMNPILLNSGNALANSDGDFTMTPTRTLKPFQLHHLTRPKYLGIIARNPIAMNQPICGK